MLLYLFFFVGLLLIFSVRVCYVMYMTMTCKRHRQPKRSSKDQVKTVIVIGSGGHTTEMLHLVSVLSRLKYSPRIYIMASSDIWSEQKIHECEDKINNSGHNSTYSIFKIPRSRSVHQSYISSVFTSIFSILYTIPILLWHNPNLVLCNGPGTCIPVCFIAFIMRCLSLSNNVIIFVESICRVKSLSLSGKMLQLFADEILVQWPDLVSKYSRAKYIGRA